MHEDIHIRIMIHLQNKTQLFQLLPGCFGAFSSELRGGGDRDDDDDDDDDVSSSATSSCVLLAFKASSTGDLLFSF